MSPPVTAVIDFRARQRSAIRWTLALLAAFAAAVVGVVVVLYPFLYAGVFVVCAWAEIDLAHVIIPWALHLKLMLWCSVGVAVVLLGMSLACVMNLRRGGGAGLLRRMGARRVDRRDGPEQVQLLNVVEEMAIASGMPVPLVFLFEGDESINACAAGYSVDDAVIGVTRGLLRHLNRDETQGVIAHEFSHIVHGDMAINMHLIGWLRGIEGLGSLGEELCQIGFRVRRAGVPFVAIGAGLFVAGYGGHWAAQLLKRAISRQREYLADAAAVEFTRNPDGLAGALKKIGGIARGSSLGLAFVDEMSHMFIHDPSRSWMRSEGWLATHPPLTERILRIDPGFDGIFPKLTAPPPAPLPRVARPSGVRGTAAAPEFGSVRAPSVDLMHDHLRGAAFLLESLPAALRAAAADPESAFGLACALQVGARPSGAAQGAVVVEGLDAELLLVRNLPLAARLPLIDLMIPALRRLSDRDRAELGETLLRLAAADGRETVLEYTLQTILAPTLSTRSGYVPAAERRYSISGLEAEAGVVLSRLAHLTATDARAAFGQGVPHVQARGVKVPFLDEEACSMPKFRLAVLALKALGLSWRRRILDAALAVINADGGVRPEEAELYRALASALDCPVPLPAKTVSSLSR